MISEFIILPHTVMNIDQSTVAALSNKYAILELKQESDNFQKSQYLSHIGHIVMLPNPPSLMSQISVLKFEFLNILWLIISLSLMSAIGMFEFKIK